MKIETKEIYKCDHCNKLYQRKHHCEIHEQRCMKNPNNRRACFGCVFLEKKDTLVYEGHRIGGEDSYKIGLLFCGKKQIYVYPPITEHKGNFIDLGDIENEAMPKECELYSTYLTLTDFRHGHI